MSLYKITKPHKARYETSCQGKQTFPSGKIAEKVCRNMNRSSSRRKVTPYRCPFCREFHIGSRI